MKAIYAESNYVADPHGAVGYLGCKEYLKEHPNTQCIFLETAHPVKFLDVVEETLDIKVAIPSQIESVMGKEKKFHKIKTYEELKTYLNS
jgi:threonine synthase